MMQGPRWWKSEADGNGVVGQYLLEFALWRLTSWTSAAAKETRKRAMSRRSAAMGAVRPWDAQGMPPIQRRHVLHKRILLKHASFVLAGQRRKRAGVASRRARLLEMFVTSGGPAKSPLHFWSGHLFAGRGTTMSKCVSLSCLRHLPTLHARTHPSTPAHPPLLFFSNSNAHRTPLL